MTTTADLSTQTPVEIDTALAEIYGRLYRVYDQIDQHTSWIEDYSRGLEKKAETIASGKNPFGGQYSGYSEAKRDELVAKREALREQAVEIRNETRPFNAEFQRRPWTRFFLVQNNGGHIHSSMSCSTCNKDGKQTRFGWLPDLSGQSEPEAVAAHGAILCTVCYPSAPVEWTDRRDPSVCDGSGRYYNSDLPHRTGYYSGNYGTCEVCGEIQSVSKTGKIRKHKKP